MVKATGDLITADDWNNLAVVPVGAVLAWPVDTAPSGWLLCVGQAVSRTEYATLFAVVGTTYGAGDGGSTFNLPDLRGRFSLGKDNMGGTSANRVTDVQADTLGGVSGAEKHTLNLSEMPSHNHGIKTAGGTQQSAKNWHAGQNDLTPVVTHYTEAAGGGQGHNNMPPYLTLNYIIKA